MDFEIFEKNSTPYHKNHFFFNSCGPHLHDLNHSSSLRGQQRLGGEFLGLDSPRIE